MYVFIIYKFDNANCLLFYVFFLKYKANKKYQDGQDLELDFLWKVKKIGNLQTIMLESFL